MQTFKILLLDGTGKDVDLSEHLDLANFPEQASRVNTADNNSIKIRACAGTHYLEYEFIFAKFDAGSLFINRDGGWHKFPLENNWDVVIIFSHGHLTNGTSKISAIKYTTTDDLERFISSSLPGISLPTINLDCQELISFDLSTFSTETDAGDVFQSAMIGNVLVSPVSIIAEEFAKRQLDLEHKQSEEADAKSASASASPTDHHHQRRDKAKLARKDSKLRAEISAKRRVNARLLQARREASSTTRTKARTAEAGVRENLKGEVYEYLINTAVSVVSIQQAGEKRAEYSDGVIPRKIADLYTAAKEALAAIADLHAAETTTQQDIDDQCPEASQQSEKAIRSLGLAREAAAEERAKFPVITAHCHGEFAKLMKQRDLSTSVDTPYQANEVANAVDVLREFYEGVMFIFKLNRNVKSPDVAALKAVVDDYDANPSQFKSVAHLLATLEEKLPNATGLVHASILDRIQFCRDYFEVIGEIKTSSQEVTILVRAAIENAADTSSDSDDAAAASATTSASASPSVSRPARPNSDYYPDVTAKYSRRMFKELDQKAREKAAAAAKPDSAPRTPSPGRSSEEE